MASITLHLFRKSIMPTNSVCFFTSPRYAQQLCAFSKSKSLAGCDDDPACSVVFSCSDIVKSAKQTKTHVKNRQNFKLKSFGNKPSLSPKRGYERVLTRCECE